MHLFALCYEQDLKKYGFDHVLEKFVAEMKLLQKVGFEIVLPVAGKCTIYASICQVTCDNLAVNSMLGFIESFACDFFCPFVMRHRIRSSIVSVLNIFAGAQFQSTIRVSLTLQKLQDMERITAEV